MAALKINTSVAKKTSTTGSPSSPKSAKCIHPTCTSHTAASAGCIFHRASNLRCNAATLTGRCTSPASGGEQCIHHRASKKPESVPAKNYQRVPSVAVKRAMALVAMPRASSGRDAISSGCTSCFRYMDSCICNQGWEAMRRNSFTRYVQKA